VRAVCSFENRRVCLLVFLIKHCFSLSYDGANHVFPLPAPYHRGRLHACRPIALPLPLTAGVDVAAGKHATCPTWRTPP
jgi:hypothetical protein